MAHIDREFENQASLISKAKAEWAKKTMPKEAKEGGGEFAKNFFFWRFTIARTLAVVRKPWPGGEYVALWEYGGYTRIEDIKTSPMHWKSPARIDWLTLSLLQSSLILTTRSSTWKRI